MLLNFEEHLVDLIHLKGLRHGGIKVEIQEFQMRIEQVGET